MKQKEAREDENKIFEDIKQVVLLVYIKMTYSQATIISDGSKCF
jgi:hypothetical protein